MAKFVTFEGIPFTVLSVRQWHMWKDGLNMSDPTVKGVAISVPSLVNIEHDSSWILKTVDSVNSILCLRMPIRWPSTHELLGAEAHKQW